MDEHSFLIDSLGRLADALKTDKDDFALTGGLAFSALVQPRATIGIDLLVLAGDQSPSLLSEALVPLFDAVMPHAEPMILSGARIWRIVGIQGKRELVIDFLMGDSDFHREALHRKLTIDFHGRSLPIVTIEDLYLLKRRADRPQDRVDVDVLTKQRSSSMDWPYIHHWLDQWALPS